MPSELSIDRTSTHKRCERGTRKSKTQFEIIVPQTPAVDRNIKVRDVRTDGAKTKRRRRNRKGHTRARVGLESAPISETSVPWTHLLVVGILAKPRKLIRFWHVRVDSGFVWVSV